MKTIAIEEHFTTPMYRQNVATNEFRNFYLTSRSEQIGHDIVAELADLGAKRLAHMDAAGVDVQVLSFSSPGPQAFGAEIAIPMARDANDRLHEAVRAHPDRFAGFAALPTANPEAAAEELERTVKKLGFKGAMINGHTQGSFLDERKYWSSSSAHRRSVCRSICIPRCRTRMRSRPTSRATRTSRGRAGGSRWIRAAIF